VKKHDSFCSVCVWHGNRIYSVETNSMKDDDRCFVRGKVLFEILTVFVSQAAINNKRAKRINSYMKG
jgi:hypothetical protein